MQFLHQREYLHQGDVVVVNCSHRCNIRLMSDSDFSSYRRGGIAPLFWWPLRSAACPNGGSRRWLLEYHPRSGRGQRLHPA